jgi:ATP-dependent DNA ligase
MGEQRGTSPTLERATYSPSASNLILPNLRIRLADPGGIVFRHACKLGFEGIVSKRLGSIYRSGRSKDWLKFKNPDHAIPITAFRAQSALVRVSGGEAGRQ